MNPRIRAGVDCGHTQPIVNLGDLANALKCLDPRNSCWVHSDGDGWSCSYSRDVDGTITKGEAWNCKTAQEAYDTCVASQEVIASEAAIEEIVGGDA